MPLENWLKRTKQSNPCFPLFPYKITFYKSKQHMWIMTPQSFHWPIMSQMKFHRHASHKFCISDTVQPTPSDLNQHSFFCWATLRLSIMEVTGTVKCNMPILLSKYSGINLLCIFHSTPHHLQPSTFAVKASVLIGISCHLLRPHSLPLACTQDSHIVSLSLLLPSHTNTI